MSRTHWKLWYSYLWFFTAKDTDLHQPREEVHAAESRKVPSVKLPVLSPWTIDWTSSSQSWCMTICTEYCQCSQGSSPELGCPEFLLALSNAGIRGFIEIYFFFFFLYKFYVYGNQELNISLFQQHLLTRCLCGTFC